MTEDEYLSTLLNNQTVAAQPQLIPIPSLEPPTQPPVQQPIQNIQNNQNPHTGNVKPLQPKIISPEEKINALGKVLGAVYGNAIDADSKYIDLGNPNGFRERDAARENLKKIAYNLDQQKQAIKQGRQRDLRPVDTIEKHEPVIPNFVEEYKQVITQPIQNPIYSNQPVYATNQPSVVINNNQLPERQIKNDSQLEFNFKEYTIEDVLNEISKLQSKINDINILLTKIDYQLTSDKKKLK